MLLAAALVFILALIVGAVVWQKQATGTREPTGGIAVTAGLALVAVIGVMLSLWWRQ